MTRSSHAPLEGPLHEQSALALSHAIHAREISARELMEATLARIEAVNPSVNAVISLRDTQELLGEAEAADADARATP